MVTPAPFLKNLPTSRQKSITTISHRQCLQVLTVVELAVVIAGKVFWTFIAIMSVFGAMRLVFIEKSSLAVFLLLVVLYFITVTVTSTGFGVGARLRYPIDPLLLLFAVYRLRNIQSLRAYGGYSQKT